MRETKLAEFYWWVEKGHAWKDSGVMTQWMREVEVGTLLWGNDKNKYTWSIDHTFQGWIIIINFLLINADLLKISVIFIEAPLHNH